MCDCNGSSSSIHYTTSNTPCPRCANCCTTCPSVTNSCGENDCTIDSADVTYTGPGLVNIDGESGDSVEYLLQKLNEQIGSVSGTNFSSFNLACITNEGGSHITTLQQFAERASDYMCNLEIVHNTFVSEYNTFVTEITQTVEGNNTAGITSCAYVGIIPDDTNAEAWTKATDKICELKTLIDITGINWDVYGFTVGTVPITIKAAINKLLTYIGTVSTSIPTGTVTLPVFDNTSSCLGGILTTTDTLVTTVGKIKTKLCSLDYDISGLSFGCVTPSATLPGTLQNIITRLNQHSLYTFDNTYFTVTAGGTGCLAKTISLNPTGLDKKVASNSSDTTPGYLIDKLQAGSGISLDDTTTSGKVIINSVSIGDHKVLVNSSDTTADYLDTKIDGTVDSTGALTLNATTNGSNSKVIITPSIDLDVLQAKLLDYIQTHTGPTNAWSSFICSADCTPAGPTVRFISTAGSTDKSVTIQADQSVPTLPWYNSGAVIISMGSSITGGPFPITTTVTNPICTLSIANNGLTAYNVHITVTDVFGIARPASSNITTSIVSGSPYVNTGFQLGTGATDYVVHIDFV